MPIHLDRLEKQGIYFIAFLVAVMLGVIFFTAFARGIRPPSNVVTVDSARLHLSEEFAEDKLGARTNPDGSVTVTMVAARYGFYPQQVEVPAQTKVTFRLASLDVVHGIHIPRTNMSTMIIPGFVSEVTTQFPRPGEYPAVCNEYCGLGHHYMWGRVTVVPKAPGK
jgi:cytochrome c oxidase subunit II